MRGKYRLSTLGCKVNQYESEQVRELLESFGMREARDGEQAELAIVNTCAVTCSATSKSRQTLRRLSKRGSTPTIAIGCYASADPDAVAGIEGVTHVLGHESDALARIREFLARRVADARRQHVHRSDAESPGLVQVGLRLATPGAPPVTDQPAHPDPSNAATTPYSIQRNLSIVKPEEPFAAPIREFAGHTRAFLKIQDGCDAHCTYCIIPNLRTRVGFKPVEAAVEEARRLVAGGHREIVLTGIFLGAYGRPTALRKRFEPGPTPLAGLVDRLARVEGLHRLRLSSLEPGDVDDALLEVLARHDNCVPHLHLPLQAGSEDVLRRMNRQYTVADFVKMIDRVRSALDRPAISTDIIVGFPGETDALFAETLEVARYSGFCKIHAFPFSPRPGTAAARWSSSFVHNQTVKERMQALRALETELAQAYERQFVGQVQRVLVEGVGTGGRNEDHAGAGEGEQADGNGAAAAESSRPAMQVAKTRGSAHGRCDRYFEVHFDAPEARPGDLVDVRIDRVTPGRVHGTLMQSNRVGWQ